ncbi:hypothetical protein [Cytobacillus sp. FSL R5-0596]|uniref:hypothetical protein n=1 Tax=Cytobacillus sp. FSL R5-0596 TaxID=2954696 RepID=UPI0030F74247
MNNKKKIMVGTAAIALFLGAFSNTVGATGFNQANQNESVNVGEQESVQLYKYDYKGLEIEGDTPLTEIQLEDIYQMAHGGQSAPQVPNQDPVITPFANDPGGSNAIRIGDVYKQEHKNKWTREFVNLGVAYIASKLPMKITKSTLGNYYFNTLTGWISSFVQPQYTGTWVTRAWSSYYGMYIYSATLVHYTDKTYKTPKKVQYWEVNRSTKSNLAG